MVASPELSNTDRPTNPETSYQEEMCDKLIQLSFTKIVNSKTERGGARLHKNLLILHLLQKARWEQRNRLLHGSMAMDTTSHVSEHQNASSHSEQDSSCEDSVCAVGNADTREQMQTGQLVEEAEDAIEIDETPGQQQETPSISQNDDEAGTFSRPSYDAHLASPCLSSLAPSASPESGFDGNYDGPGTTLTQPSPPIIHSRQQASSRQENQGFDFSTDVKPAANDELQATHGHSSEPVMKRGDNNEEGEPLRHPGAHQRHHPRHRRPRSASATSKRTLQRNHSASTSSSSSDSDDSSSSEEGYFHGSDMEGAEGKKQRDCLKRKLDDSYGSDEMAVENAPVSACEWYSSPKMACIVHGGAVTETTNLPHQQHPNLNGLISVLQSAALTSDEPSKAPSNGKHEEDPQLTLAARICDPESGDGNSPLTRSLSCPGLLELACES